MNRHERMTQRARGSVRVQPPPAKEPTAVEYLQVKIPLKPQEKPVAFPQRFAETLQEEYAIKYLQRLGAMPTAENIAVVLKNLPLDECQITSAWKARGSLADVVMVDLYPKPHNGLRLAPEIEEFNSTGLRMRDPRRRVLQPGVHDDHVDDALATTKPYQVGCVCMSFDDMKHRYLLPFKHGTRREADVLTMFAMKHDEPVTFVHVPALAEIHTKPTLQLFGRRATQRRIRCIEERVHAPEVKSDFTMQVLTTFVASLPFASLGVRTDAEQSKLCDLLVHGDLVHLVEATVRYLYLEVFFKLGCLGAADLIKSGTIETYHESAPIEIETLYVTVVRLFNVIKQRMQREEKGLAVYLPLHLLALRVAVETIFRCQYPVSFSITAPTMQYILVEMDDQITKVLDGDLHLSRIGILETTCESSKVMVSHPYQARKRRSRLRDQFYQTSEALHTIFPNPLPGKCRKMIKFRGGAAVGNYPAPTVSPTELKDSNQTGAEASPRHELHAFEEAARSAALPTASLETRLELLHLMERTQTKATRTLPQSPASRRRGSKPTR